MGSSICSCLCCFLLCSNGCYLLCSNGGKWIPQASAVRQPERQVALPSWDCGLLQLGHAQANCPLGWLRLPALCFLWRSFEEEVAARTGNAGKPSTKPAPGKPSTKPAPGNGVDFAEVTNVRINAGMVNMVASLAYLAMATKHGYTTRCNGRDFYYARYVDWIITTPLMLYDLAVVGGSDFNTRLFLCGIDIIMIVSGLIGSLVEDSGAGLGGTNEKWGFFGFSMLCFIPVLWYLCAM